MNHLGGRSDILGLNVLVHNFPLTVIGVAPASFEGIHPLAVPALWIPATMTRQAGGSSDPMAGVTGGDVQNTHRRGVLDVRQRDAFRSNTRGGRTGIITGMVVDGDTGTPLTVGLHDNFNGPRMAVSVGGLFGRGE